MENGSVVILWCRWAWAYRRLCLDCDHLQVDVGLGDIVRWTYGSMYMGATK